MVSKEEIYWVAGLLEGEGYFGSEKNTPRVTLGMTDLDTVEKFASIVGATTTIEPCIRGRKKVFYRVSINGARAAGVMQTVYSLMSKRRQARIREVLPLWKESRRNRKLSCSQRKQIAAEVKLGLTKMEVARRFSISRRTVYEITKTYQLHETQ